MLKVEEQEEQEQEDEEQRKEQEDEEQREEEQEKEKGSPRFLLRTVEALRRANSTSVSAALPPSLPHYLLVSALVLP